MATTLKGGSLMLMGGDGSAQFFFALGGFGGERGGEIFATVSTVDNPRKECDLRIFWGVGGFFTTIGELKSRKRKHKRGGTIRDHRARRRWLVCFLHMHVASVDTKRPPKTRENNYYTP